MPLRTAALILMSVASLAACAARGGEAEPAQTSLPGRDCVNVAFVTGYDTVDRDTVRLEAGPGASYEIDLSGAQCNTVEWSQRLAIESTPSSWICVGAQLGQGRIYFREPATRLRISCEITEVRRAQAPAG